MYYLEFCKNKPAKKISWAASIGSESKHDLEMMAPILKERLKNLDYISVRERESVDFVQTLTDKKVVHAIDPVLMLDKDDYDEILPDFPNELGRYIYTFLFDNVEGGYETINKLSAHTKLPVVANVKELNRIDNLLLDSEDDGPSEIIEKIFNADYIITDSYHIMIYAILSKKPFIAYSRVNSGIRLRNLLEDLGLSSKFLQNNQEGFEEILKEIDYGKVYERIDKWRNSTMEFLNDALNVD
jgi:polysaccharide pyruvyl transferase WcaK-like protein